MSFAVAFATCLSTDLQLTSLQSCAFIIALCHTCGLNIQGIPYARMYLNKEFACIAAPWAGKGGGPSTGARQRSGWGPPESGVNANRDQNWAEVVESGKNATQEIRMLTHPAAGQNPYYFCNISDLSPYCKKQREDSKQRDDIYTSDDPDRILSTSATSAISPHVVTTSVKSQNNAMIFTHLTSKYLLLL